MSPSPSVGGSRAPGSASRSLLLLGLLLLPTAVQAQTFQGRVVEDGSDAPVPTALVSLLDEEGQQIGVSITDSAGAYRVEASEPGIFRLRAERIGFATFETPLLEAQNEDGAYTIDLVLQTDPFELPGFTVMTDRVTDEEADREVRLMIGISPASLRYDPMGYDEIRQHVEVGRTLYEAVRAGNYAGVMTRWTTDGPCFSLRARGCLPVYFNGLRLRGDFVADIPLDTVYRIVLVTPTDGSPNYPGGALLLYTEAWLR